MKDNECVFCRIIAGELPSIALYQDDACVAFMDINPAARGHLLVVSRQHAVNLLDIGPDQLQGVTAAVQKLARAVDLALKPEGISVIQSNGPGAAQSVSHFHVHVLPRSLYDDLSLNWHLTPGDRHVIEETARQIRAALEPQ